MPPIPVYLKTSADMPRPADPVYYLLTRDGAFLCRNHPFFASDVPTSRPIRALEAHAPRLELNYPRVPAELLEQAVGFFGRIYELHGSESVVLLIWDTAGQRYHLVVPDQEAEVWVSGRSRAGHDVKYEVPVLPAGHLLAGDIHSHGPLAAYTSLQDAQDERHRDGIHAVVGRLDQEPADFHVEVAIDGERFAVPFWQVFAGYDRRSATVPEEWLARVRIRQNSWRTWYDDRPIRW